MAQFVAILGTPNLLQGGHRPLAPEVLCLPRAAGGRGRVAANNDVVSRRATTRSLVGSSGAPRSLLLGCTERHRADHT
jgi:hypothetical protein